MFAITAEWLELHATGPGGWTARQLATLGISWPPVKGWRSRLVGQVITAEQVAEFERKVPRKPKLMWTEAQAKNKASHDKAVIRRAAKKARKQALRQAHWWFGPEFTREPDNAPCFLGPLLGKNAIYVLVDPRTKTVAYVGKTVNVDRRFWNHLTYPHNASLMRWQRGLKREKLSPLMVVMDSANEDWEDAERAWIAYYRERGSLMNIEDGGKRKVA